MRVTIIGSGYVGLVSGACFADFGHDVVCVDTDAAKIERLKDGIMPIFEPGLEELVAANVKAGRLSFTTDLREPVRNSSAVFIAVGTPSRRGDGHADLGYVEQAARDIAQAIDGFTVVVNKSTVPVGSGDLVSSIIQEERPDGDFSVVSNPEFLREGAAIEDFKRPDRVVVGTTDERAREVMRELYRPLFLNETPIVFTDRRTSELIKYAANAFLAVKIAFINEIADLCETVDANVQEVAKGIGLDNRIGKKFLNAGPGYGGSCFPKDTLALVKTAQDAGTPVTIVEATVAANNRRKSSMAHRVIQAAGGSVDGKVIGILGLTFKPNTDDMRDAPSLDIIPALISAGAQVRAFDPEGMTEAKHMLPDVTFCSTPYEVCDGTDVLTIVTEWDQFRALDLSRVAKLMKSPVIVDLRNIYSPAEMLKEGFIYSSIGRSQ
jgi:UDPglucose 6-dehydrogenase